MYKQIPLGQVEAFRAYHGFVEHLYLDTRVHALNSEGYYADFRQVSGVLNLNFGRENIQGNQILNSGSTGNNFSLTKN